MAEKDLQRFLKKVNHLNGLVQSLNEHPERRQQLAACDDHNSVVQLARSWGFEIARRWGMKREKSSIDRLTTCYSGRIWNLERSKSACFAKVLVGG